MQVHGVILEHSLFTLLKISMYGHDGGVIVTSNKTYYEKLKLLRNHGLIDRDTVKICGYNSRLDTFQAVVEVATILKQNKLQKKEFKMQNC